MTPRGHPSRWRPGSTGGCSTRSARTVGSCRSAPASVSRWPSRRCSRAVRWASWPLPTVRADRVEQPPVDPGRHLEGCPRGVIVLDHDDELVATGARDRSAPGGRRPQHARDMDQHVVTCRVPVPVVDLLELVEVDRQHGNPARGILRLDGLLQDFLHEHPVGQPGQRVVHRPVRKHLGLHPSVGDISELNNEVVRCALRRSHQHDVQHRPSGLAVEPQDAPGRVAVLAIDLDEFKEINDRYGHPAGDDVLVHVAGVLRAATAGRGTVSRTGGDEFVVVIQDNDAARASFEVAAGIHRGLLNPVRTHRRQLPVRASIGIAVAEPSVLTGGAMGILGAADAALYRAKGAGRSRTEVFDRSMTMATGSKHGAVAELVQAIERGELVLHYQPTVDLATGVVVGHEALVRWQHPERGLLLPGSFLPTAVESGLAVKLGTNVVRQAAAFLARTEATGHWVSVNVSVEQLGDGEFAAQALMAISRNRVAPGRLVVELTEAGLVESGSRVRHELARLRAAGIPVLLDDFGTGIAPLSYLRDLPVDGVKLDMSFTVGIPEDPAAARVSRALGALAREMGMITIAEGIETLEQARFLRECGWHYGQGWLFGAGESERVTVGAVEHP